MTTNTTAKYEIQRNTSENHESATSQVMVTCPMLKSEELLQGKAEIMIQHGPEFYRLRQTKAGKLLLYK